MRKIIPIVLCLIVCNNQWSSAQYDDIFQDENTTTDPDLDDIFAEESTTRTSTQASRTSTRTSTRRTSRTKATTERTTAAPPVDDDWEQPEVKLFKFKR